MSKQDRTELSRRRPLPPHRAQEILKLLSEAGEHRTRLINEELTYAEARQLCHDAGIRQIKGNCRKVLARRLGRLTTVDKTGRLAAILQGTNHNG